MKTSELRDAEPIKHAQADRLNYQIRTVTRNGTADTQLSTLSLEAGTLGAAYTPKGDGIVLETTNGQVSLQVTSLHVLDAAQAPPSLNVYNEGFATDQNVPGVVLVHGQPGIAGLLDNDSATDGSTLSFAAVGNARNGSVSYDANAGSIRFTPNSHRSIPTLMR